MDSYEISLGEDNLKTAKILRYNASGHVEVLNQVTLVSNIFNCFEAKVWRPKFKYVTQKPASMCQQYDFSGISNHT